ncbi:hypothetical protein COW09_01195 [bacterium (Candidatus Moisslbacteria) CG12_big_fil_rev_8_21_14_0_65_36_11]|nr:MAG: hypothetical protein COW09_01195 [bacterium (Candidatus Moisslbacteria) CG12_big_fil_rev_8_21_14_0_65_36_11]
MTPLITIIIVFSLLVVGLFYLLNQRIKKFEEDKSKDQSFLLLNQSLQGMHERLDKAAQALTLYSKGLGTVEELSRQIQGFQDFFRSPKLRGNIGEQVLENLLSENLTQEHFKLQYRFKDGQIVDAIIKFKNQIIPIDAKFPLDNYSKLARAVTEKEREMAEKMFNVDVKREIDKIAKNYILPQEGTVDYAVMYIPSETIYYEILTSKNNLFDYARSKKVFTVSPNTFLGFLRTVMLGMKGEQIKEEYQQVLEILRAVSHDTEKLGETLSVVTKHINDAKNSLDRLNNEYFKLNSKVDQIKLLK